MPPRKLSPKVRDAVLAFLLGEDDAAKQLLDEAHEPRRRLAEMGSDLAIDGAVDFLAGFRGEVVSALVGYATQSEEVLREVAAYLLEHRPDLLQPNSPGPDDDASAALAA